MAVARHVTHYGLRATLVTGYGYFDGLGSQTNLFIFRWEKLASALTGGEQTQLASILAFLNTYIANEDAPTGVVARIVYEPVITTNDAGTVPTGADNRGGKSSGAFVQGFAPLMGYPGGTRISVHAGGSPTTLLTMESMWSKALAAFTGGEQTTLNSFVAALGAYLAADLPLPPWT